MPKLKASEVRDFTVPVSDRRPSPHGSQREDAIIDCYLSNSGWYREVSDAAYAAIFPDVPQAHEGNGRGRGRTAGDLFRPNYRRAGGGDVAALKCPKLRANGTCATAHEMFKGTRATAVALLRAVGANWRHRKAFPVAVVHTDGDTFSPSIVEWCIRDVGAMYAAPTNGEGWPVWNGIPVKPVDDRDRGAGGSPASVWITFLRRELLGYHSNGTPKVRYTPDNNGTYCTITASFSKRSGAVFRTGTPAQFAADLDAATVLR